MSDDFLHIGADVDVKAIQNGMDAGAQAVKTSTEDMKKQFDALALHVKDLDAQIVKLQKSLDEGGKGFKEMGNSMEARHGTMLFTEEAFGVRLPRAISGLVSSLGPVAAIMEAAFPVLVIIELVKLFAEAFEKAKKHREEMEKLAGAGRETAASMKEVSDQLEIENLKLEDSIRALEHKPPKNGLVIAAKESEDELDKLIAKIDKAVESFQNLFKDMAHEGLWNSIKDLGNSPIEDTVKQAAKDMLNMDATLEYWKKKRAIDRELETAAITDEEKKRAAKAVENDDEQYKKQLAANRKFADDKRRAFQDDLTATTSALEKEQARNEDLKKNPVIRPGKADLSETNLRESNLKIANLKEEQKALADAMGNFLAMDATLVSSGKALTNEAKKDTDTKKKLSLEEMKTRDEQFTTDYETSLKLIDIRQKEADSAVKNASVGIKAMPEKNDQQVDAKVNAEVEAAAKEYAIQSNSETERFQSLEAWWGKVNQNDKTNRNKYLVALAEHYAKVQEISNSYDMTSQAAVQAGENKKLDIQNRAFAAALKDQEKGLQEEEAAVRATAATGIAAIQNDVSRKLITRQEEYRRLKEIYDKEIQALRDKINAEIALETAAAARAHSQGDDQAEEAHLKAARDLQDRLNAAIREYNKEIANAQTKTQSMYLTGKQFAAQMDTAWRDTAEHLKHYWQDAINQMNSGFISSFNTMLETGKGFGEGMRQTFGKILEGFLDMLIEMVIQWVESLILMAIFGKTSDKEKAQSSIASSAAQAGAAGVASWAGAPWPLDAGAPAFGALMYGNAMAYAALGMFEQGGIIPETGMYMMHRGEEVYNPSKSQGKDGKGLGPRGVTVQINHSPNVNAIDTRGMNDALAGSATFLAELVSQELRRRGY